MIVVTGATGQLGGLIVRSLLASSSTPQSVGVSVRDPGKAGELTKLGVRVRKGEFGDQSSLLHAFEGASQVLLVSSNGRREGHDAVAQHATAINAAVQAGVKRIVYTSHMGAHKDSRFPPMADHVETEKLLRSSGIAWTALRNGFYAESAVDLIRDSFESGIVSLPLDGKVSWTAHKDLAEAAAAILLDDGKFEGPTPPLTGVAALDLADLAALYGDISGKSMSRHVVSDESFEESLVRSHVPKSVIPVVMGLYKASRAGEFAAVDPTLAALLKRPPTSMREVLASASKTGLA